MLKLISSAVVALVLVPGSALAGELRDGEIRAREVIRGTQVTFEVQGWPKEAGGVMLSIEGPGDYAGKDEFGGSVPAFDLKKYGDLMDGDYYYEISGSTGEKIKVKKLIDDGRGKDPSEYTMATFSLAGKLVVVRRQIVIFEQPEEKEREKPVEGDPNLRDDDLSGSGRDEKPGDEPDDVVIDEVKDGDG